MSVQFGRWSFDGSTAPREYLAKIGEILAPYGPDGRTSLLKWRRGASILRLRHDQGIPPGNSTPCLRIGLGHHLGRAP